MKKLSEMYVLTLSSFVTDSFKKILKCLILAFLLTQKTLMKVTFPVLERKEEIILQRYS